MPYDSVAEDNECRDLTALYGAFDKTIQFFTDHPDRWLRGGWYINSAEKAEQYGGCAVAMLLHFLGAELNSPKHAQFDTIAKRCGSGFTDLVHFNDHCVGIGSTMKICDYLRSKQKLVANAIMNGLPEQKPDPVGEMISACHFLNESAGPVMFSSAPNFAKVQTYQEMAMKFIALVENKKMVKKIDASVGT